MENAHLRMATVQYSSFSGKNLTATVRVFCDRFAKGPEDAAMLSIFGNDGEVGAIGAAVSLGARLEATLPDGQLATIALGEKPVVLRGSFTLPGRARPVRHLLAFSQAIAHNGTGGGELFILDRDPAFLWAAVTSFLGLPALPAWADAGIAMLEARGAIVPLFGFGCNPVLVSVPREEVLGWIGEQVAAGALGFPATNCAVSWPVYSLHTFLSPQLQAAPL